jgi:hypothetical protein
VSVVSVEERVVLLYWSVALSVVMYLDEALGCLVWAKLFLTTNTRGEATVSRCKHEEQKKINNLFLLESIAYAIS